MSSPQGAALKDTARVPVKSPGWFLQAGNFIVTLTVDEALGNRMADRQENNPPGCFDDELVARYARGDESALAALYENYYPKLRVYVLSLLGWRDVGDAEDVVQETFVKVWCQIQRGEYRPQGFFKAFLYTVARNETLDHLRLRKRLREKFDSLEVNLLASKADESSEEFVKRLEEQDRYRPLYKAFRELSEKEQQNFVDHFVGDATWPEIAAKGGEAVGAVRMRASRAYAKLFAALKPR